jgi:hypothetical protein
MCKLKSAIIGISAFFSLLLANIGYTNDGIESFLFDYKPSQQYELYLIFAPVTKLSKTDQIKGKWSYKYDNIPDKIYTEEQKKLPKDKALKICLVSTLKKGQSYKENYLWHVIAYPRIVGWNFGGHWVIDEKKSLLTYEKVDSTSRKAMKKLSLYKKREPIFSNVSIRNVGANLELKEAWEKVFGSVIMKELVEPSNRSLKEGNQAYSFNFYYVPTPNPIGIGNEGHRWVSSKNINRAGLVYGFVLDSKGKCLKWTSLNISN